SGGDTSSQVTKVLAPDALVVAARLARGAPLCRFISSDARVDGLEVALKGGQMGDVEFFEKARRGNA
ncbi:MAG TPA: nucleotide-binding domain containing protein, partial [Burkholderiaceae bacterium]|nr:nucleotide-binding domain containing protein [Burkholderiaceae bacterium]